MTRAARPAGRGLHGDHALMIILSYLWVFALVPLLYRRTDADVNWHARHGIVLAVAELAGLLVWSMLLGVLWIMTGGLLGCLAITELIITPLAGFLVVLFHAFAIAKALHGGRLTVPYISEWADRF